jgi:hypothetical protein
MTTLAQQQGALLDALFDWPNQGAMESLASRADLTRARGLKAYQANGHALAERALAAAYPVTQQLLGDESFSSLARALWHAHPPQCGDIARWGDALAGFLQNDPQLAGEPYLADVARTEWALHRCASAADALADLSTVGLLTTTEPSLVYLDLAPGSFTLHSPWPVASIMGAHLKGEPNMHVLAIELQQGLAQDVLVWREGLQPQVREAMVGEQQFVQALLDEHTLEQALDASPQVDFAQWLPMAAQTGLLLRARARYA